MRHRPLPTSPRRGTRMLAGCAVWALLAGGCGAVVSEADLLRMAARPAAEAARPAANASEPSVRRKVAELALVRLALLEDESLGEEQARVLCALLLGDGEEEAAAHRDMLLAEYERESERARTSEPRWNRVHFASGYCLGRMGFHPEAAWALLDAWERFEHDSSIGRRYTLSDEEGVFGYLWDMEIGMAGYNEGVRGTPSPPPRAGETRRRGDWGG